MFGYIRPLKGELKVRQFEQFQSVYCGLCHTLKKRYGFFGRFVLNYDFTFLTMLLAPEDFSPCLEYRKCSASPFRKKTCCGINEVSSLAADYSLILAYWKLKDTLMDEGFLKKLYIWPFSILLKGKYNKAAALHRAFSDEVKLRLDELNQLEQANEASLDAVADKFARILEAASKEVKSVERKLITEKILYHIGRLIYILDAVDDIEEDLKAGRYNPMKNRFNLQSGKLDAESKEYIKNILHHSASIIAADFELLGNTEYTEILGNIVYLGIPNTIDQVLEDRWKTINHRRKHKL